jgi:hypothetical protein
MRNTLFLLVVICAGLAFCGPARAACTAIDHANYTITSPGEYCLTKNVVATSNGVTINADNVTLDCGGYTIDGSAQALSTTGRGVMAINRNGITIQNCTIKGFMEGIRLLGVDGTIRGNTLIAPLSRGIIVNGDGSVIDANRVTDAGGASNISLGAYGIYVTGSSIIRGNTVSGVVPTSGSDKSGYGIYTSGNNAGVIQGNIVRNVLSDGGKIGMAITAYSSVNAVLKENILSNPSNSYAYALYCSGSGNVSNGNVFLGFVYGIVSSCVSLPPQ